MRAIRVLSFSAVGVYSSYATFKIAAVVIIVCWTIPAILEDLE